MNITNITTGLKSSVLLRTNSLNVNKTISERKLDARERLKSNLTEYLNNTKVKDIHEFNQLKAAVKLAIKTIQENINHKGKSSFTNSGYYGNITSDNARGLFNHITTDERLKEDLELVCAHQSGGNRKYGFFNKTNYTSGADNLKTFIDDFEQPVVTNTVHFSTNQGTSCDQLQSTSTFSRWMCCNATYSNEYSSSSPT